MKKTLLLLLLSLMIVKFISAQEYVHQVFILNEGYFDYSINQSIEPVTIGSYNPASQSYVIIDTIQGARFASDLIVDENYFYVAADNMLHKYDKNNYDLLASAQIDGIRNLAIWDDKIIISRGDYDNTTFSPIFFNSYLQIYNKSDLSLYMEIDTISGPKWATQNLIINETNLYIAVNNAYECGNYKGIVGILDLNTFSYINEIDLGPDGINPDNMMIEGNNIYTINNKDWSGLSISKINLFTNTTTTTNLASIATGCGTSCLRDAKINYQISSDTLLYEWDIATLPNTGNTLPINNNFYDLSYDNINNLLYTSSTDYTTYGNINIYDNNNILIHTFSCGVSPGNIVFDNRSAITDIYESNSNQNIKYKKSYDLYGREINFDSYLPKGIYIQDNTKIYMNIQK